MDTASASASFTESEFQRSVNSGSLTIGSLAHVTGISAKAIRYYEEMGLLPPAERAGNRYRRYGQADVNRLTLLRRIRLLGVPLSAARSLLAITDEARCAEVQRQLLHLIDQRLEALDREIAELHTLRHETQRYQRVLAACHPKETETFSECEDIDCVGLACAVDTLDTLALLTNDVDSTCLEKLENDDESVHCCG